MSKNRDLIASEPLPEVMNAQMAEVMNYWTRKCEAAIYGPFPILSDLNLMDLYKIAGNLMICDVIRSDQDPLRYRWRYWGSELTNYFNIEMTGKFVDEAYTATTAALVTACYDWILENRQPHFWQRQGGGIQEGSEHLTIQDVNIHKTFERIIFPVIDQSGEINHLFGIMTFKKSPLTTAHNWAANVKGDIFQSN